MVNVKTKQRISNMPKFLGVVSIFFVFLLIINNGKKNSVTDRVEGPRQSQWDNSVECVEDFIKNRYLRDPDSYQSIKWYKVEKNDNGTFQVTHTFRAKNGFGGYSEQTLTFIIDKSGSKVTSYN